MKKEVPIIYTLEFTTTEDLADQWVESDGTSDVAPSQLKRSLQNPALSVFGMQVTSDPTSGSKSTVRIEILTRLEIEVPEEFEKDKPVILKGIRLDREELGGMLLIE